MESRIKELRKKHKMSQRALGGVVNVSQQTISKIEKDIQRGQIDVLVNIANHFSVTVDYLLRLTNYKRSIEGEIMFEKVINEHYDIFMTIKELNSTNLTTLQVLLYRLKEAQEEIHT